MVWPDLSGRIRASLTIVPLEKLLEATLGDTTFGLFKTWTSEFAEQDWLVDKDIRDYLKRYCTVTAETKRYDTLVALNNRILAYAQGRLTGVAKQDAYALKNVTYAKNALQPVPVAHGQAPRRPDLIMTTTTAQTLITELKEQIKAAKEKGVQETVDELSPRLEELGWGSITTWIEVKSSKHRSSGVLNKVLETLRTSPAMQVRFN